MNECLVQWLHCIAQNHIDSKEVISCFDDIIDLDCFAAGDDAVGFVQQLDGSRGSYFVAAAYLSPVSLRVQMRDRKGRLSGLPFDAWLRRLRPIDFPAGCFFSFFRV